MFDQLREAIEPASLLSLVPEEVLRGLMKGFSFGHRSGVVLIFDDGRAATNLLTLKRLDAAGPNPRAREGYNPFCAKFREQPARDRLCEACDERFARMEYAGTKPAVRHDCHMGLADLTVPVRVNGHVRGVLFAGQKVVNDEGALRVIRRNVAAKAPDVAAELEALLPRVAVEPDEMAAFETQFCEFARTFQATVTAFAEGHRYKIERDALLQVSEYLAGLEAQEEQGQEDSGRPLFPRADELFRALESFTGLPVWLLQRRGSRYVGVAASPGGAADGGVSVNLPAWGLIETPVGRVTRLPATSPTGLNLVRRLGREVGYLTVIRSESRTGPAGWSSVALVFGGAVRSEHNSLLAGCARELMYAAGVLSLLRRLQKEQAEFARSASFIGHHMKTPLQGALLDLREAALVTSGSAEDVAERAKLLDDAAAQIGQGLDDALRLQGAAMLARKERVDLHALTVELADDMRLLARQRQLQVKVTLALAAASTVVAVRQQVRVALSNLLENAIKYSYEAKTIEVRLSNPPAHAYGRVVQIEIEDVGVGFPVEQKDRLFNLGSRLAPDSGKYARSGAGIGLLQAKEYVEAAGGSLDINSIPLATHTGQLAKVVVVVHLPLA